MYSLIHQFCKIRVVPDCFCSDINRGYNFYSGRNRVLKQGRGNGNNFATCRESEAASTLTKVSILLSGISILSAPEESAFFGLTHPQSTPKTIIRTKLHFIFATQLAASSDVIGSFESQATRLIKAQIAIRNFCKALFILHLILFVYTFVQIQNS